MKERMLKKRKDERKKEKEERKEEGKGNHRLHCWHVARPDVLLGHGNFSSSVARGHLPVRLLVLLGAS